MLSHEVSRERAWRTDSIDDSAAWYYTLSEDCLSNLRRIIRHARRHTGPITEISLPDESSNGCRECLQPALDALSSGRGFAIVERAPL